MNFYLAPMEGVTGYVYRNAYHQYYRKLDKYFTPFIKASRQSDLKAKELRDVLPENNTGIRVVPQLLSNNAADFIHTSRKLKELGYQEVNLNLGCPSNTVVTKGRGSGFLAKPRELDEFFAEVFSEGVLPVSVKTRIGKTDPEEFYQLMEIYNKYPITELIIHPRLQTDFYRNTPNWDIFWFASMKSKNPVCYNGDIFTVQDYQRFMEAFPDTDTVMMGRGIISNPGLPGMILDGRLPDKGTLQCFHDKIYEDYRSILSGDRNVLFKMKELWFYMAGIFTENEKYVKKIKKSERLSSYKDAVSALFREQELLLP